MASKYLTRSNSSSRSSSISSKDSFETITFRHDPYDEDFGKCYYNLRTSFSNSKSSTSSSQQKKQLESVSSRLPDDAHHPSSAVLTSFMTATALAATAATTSVDVVQYPVEEENDEPCYNSYLHHQHSEEADPYHQYHHHHHQASPYFEDNLTEAESWVDSYPTSPNTQEESSVMGHHHSFGYGFPPPAPSYRQHHQHHHYFHHQHSFPSTCPPPPSYMQQQQQQQQQQQHQQGYYSKATNTTTNTVSRSSESSDEISQGLSHSAITNHYAAALPEETLHTDLFGKVNFCPYPDTAFNNLEPPAHIQKSQMTRMFIGQLPYQVTEMQLGWIAYVFGGGTDLFHFEQIVRVDKKKAAKCKDSGKAPPKKAPTGCFHVYVLPEQVSLFKKGVHKRVLIDDTGVWYCGGETPEEEKKQEQALEEYCQKIRSEALAAQKVAAEAKKCGGKSSSQSQKDEDPSLITSSSRIPSGRPFSAMVIQEATSTFNTATSATPTPSSSSEDDVAESGSNLSAGEESDEACARGL